MNDRPDPRLGIGGNNPPAEIATDVQALLEKLAIENMDIEARASAIRAAMEGGRVLTVVQNDDEAARMTAFIEEIAAPRKLAQERHDIAKAPYLGLGKAVDSFFGTRIEQLRTAERTCLMRLEVYLQQKLNRQRAQEAEERARLERDRKAAAERERESFFGLKRSSGTPASDDALVPPEPKPVADATRVRAVGGGVAGLREETVVTIDDLKKVPLAKLRPYLAREIIEKAVRAYVKAGGALPLAGVSVKRVTKARVQ